MLSFRLFGIPVTIHPSFLLIAGLLGLSSGRLALLLAWVGIVFFSILIHELGHALTARAFGADVEIELNAIGGLTSWSSEDGELGPGRRAVVAAAGSGVGVFFGGTVWLFDRYTGPHEGVGGYVLSTLVLVNVFWGLLNWAPVRPLDGGHLLTSLLEKVAPEKGERIANVVFLLSAAAALAAALWYQRIFLVILAGWLLMGELTRGRPRRPPTALPRMSFDPDDGVAGEPGSESSGEPEPGVPSLEDDGPPPPMSHR